MQAVSLHLNLGSCMPDETTVRKLVGVISVDIVGYCWLMGNDKGSTGS